MDERLRRLERLAATGDCAARLEWRRALAQAGLPDPDADDLNAPLTEAELYQLDYDEIFWHRTTALRFGWDMEPRAGICKAHHKWGHRGFNPNSKRKTLRTHRDGSRSVYRLRDETYEEVEQDKSSHARRRKKRFGGKEHRRREWSYNPETERYKSWCVITKPHLDD